MANNININQNNNAVSLQDNNKNIIITDNSTGTSVNITQPTTDIITVSTPGPQGPAGQFPDTGSFVLTSSFNAFTASYYTDSASFEAQILANSSSIALLSGSFETTSGSFSTRITDLENFSSSLDATFATDAELNAATASLSASITYLSSSFEIFSGSYNTGSFSGSFEGNLNGTASYSNNSISASYALTASYVENAQTASYVEVAQTASYVENAQTVAYALQALSASYAISASYEINYETSSSYAETASIAYTASYVENAQTASYYDETDPVFVAKSGSFATTGSNIFDGDQTISGNLYQSGTFYPNQIDWFSSSIGYDTGSYILTTTANGLTTYANYQDVANIINSGVVLTSSFNAYTGSNTSQFAGTSSYALTASYVENAQTASYVLNAISSSYALSSSYATSASHAESSSYAISSSYALSASHAESSSYAITSSYALFAETASNALNAQDILIYVLNQSGQNIAKGVVVHITASGNSSDIPRIITASYENDANSANTLGITNQAIANGAEGYVMTEGILKGINTQAFTSGQLIYLGATGSIIGTAPVAPLHSVRLGQVVRQQSNNGSIYVRIDNGYEIEELHDVLILTSSLQYGDLLMRSGSVWTNSKQLSGSYSLTGNFTAASITASNLYAGNTFISGSLTVLQGATIYGSSSFQYVTSSQLAVSASFISVNVFEPVERFGGLKVYDSGSSSASASLAWDSFHNHWVYQNVSGSTYTGGMLLSGPRNTGSLGDEPNLTLWYVPRSDGGDHLNDSQIYSSGSTTIVTGSLTVTNGITGSLSGSATNATSASYAQTASYVETAQTASYILNAVSSSYALTSSFAQTASYIDGGFY